MPKNWCLPNTGTLTVVTFCEHCIYTRAGFKCLFEKILTFFARNSRPAVTALTPEGIMPVYTDSMNARITDTIVDICVLGNIIQFNSIQTVLVLWRKLSETSKSLWTINYLKSLNAKTDISICINLRYLRLKLLKNKENNKKICHIFHHNFNNIPCYVMSEVTLKRFYFALFDGGLTLKTLKLAFICFLIQTLLDI